MEKRRQKPCLPSLIVGNVRSLVNKADELTTPVRSQREYRECSLMCLRRNCCTRTSLTTVYPSVAFRLLGPIGSAPRAVSVKERASQDYTERPSVILVTLTEKNGSVAWQ